jgi:hypothetical protein
MAFHFVFVRLTQRIVKVQHKYEFAVFFPTHTESALHIIIYKKVLGVKVYEKVARLSYNVSV